MSGGWERYTMDSHFTKGRLNTSTEHIEFRKSTGAQSQERARRRTHSTLEHNEGLAYQERPRRFHLGSPGTTTRRAREGRSDYRPRWTLQRHGAHVNWTTFRRHILHWETLDPNVDKIFWGVLDYKQGIPDTGRRGCLISSNCSCEGAQNPDRGPLGPDAD